MKHLQKLLRKYRQWRKKRRADRLKAYRTEVKGLREMLDTYRNECERAWKRNDNARNALRGFN